MYGLVNQAIERMVCERHGEDTWERIKESAGVDIEMFISTHVYPDDVTFRLFQATCDALDVERHELLRSFGQFWLSFTAQAGFDHLLDMAGTSLAEFLENLDAVHAVLVEGFPEIQAPTFTYDPVSANEYDLHYHSVRTGLAPMVMGLVEALSRRFNQRIELEHVHRRADTRDHDIFRIRLLEG